MSSPYPVRERFSGYFHTDPFMTLSFMSLPVIPTLRLTTRGVIDVAKQQ